MGRSAGAAAAASEAGSGLASCSSMPRAGRAWSSTALDLRRQAGQPARRHRPHGDGRRRARAGGAAREPAARSRADRRAGSMPSAFSSIDETLARRPARRAARRRPISPAPCRGSRFGRGGPRDLGAVRDGLDVAPACAELLAAEGGGMGLPAELARIAGRAARQSRRRSARRSQSRARRRPAASAPRRRLRARGLSAPSSTRRAA